MLKTAPALFAVADTYQILVPLACDALVWVKVGDEEYYDESNGIMRSLSELHRITVPMAALDAARSYTLFVRPLIERKPYFTTTKHVVGYTYAFRPVPATGARIYHISDAHNRIEEPIAAAEQFIADHGPLDLLVLNGDVINHSGDPTKFANIYEICSRLTGGNIPTVFSRGNHDMRGNYAEAFAAYTPNHLGHTYYTFRLGAIWGILLDCGEDKLDDHPEYGCTVCCRAFRRRQTAFLREVIANADKEYAAPGIKTRLVIAHNPFTQKYTPPFDIEEETFAEWCRLLREEVKPDLMICGHLHSLEVRPVGHPSDHFGQPCPVVIGSKPGKDGLFTGCGIVLEDEKFGIFFTNNKKETIESIELAR